MKGWFTMTTKKSPISESVKEIVALPKMNDGAGGLRSAGLITMLVTGFPLVYFLLKGIVLRQLIDSLDSKIFHFLIIFVIGAVVFHIGNWLAGFSKNPDLFLQEHEHWLTRYRLLLWTLFYTGLLLLMREGIRVLAVDYGHQQARTNSNIFIGYIPTFICLYALVFFCFRATENYRKEKEKT